MRYHAYVRRSGLGLFYVFTVLDVIVTYHTRSSYSIGTMRCLLKSIGDEFVDSVLTPNDLAAMHNISSTGYAVAQWSVDDNTRALIDYIEQTLRNVTVQFQHVPPSKYLAAALCSISNGVSKQLW